MPAAMLYVGVCFRLGQSLFSSDFVALMKVCIGVNDISGGSPSRMRIVRRISFGMTTRPRSSIRRTIPVAFMFFSPLAQILIADSICELWEIMRRADSMLQRMKSAGFTDAFIKYGE